MLGKLLRADFSLGMEGLEVGRPLGAKDVCAREGAVTTTDDEGVDAFLDEVVCGGLTSLGGAEGL